MTARQFAVITEIEKPYNNILQCSINQINKDKIKTIGPNQNHSNNLAAVSIFKSFLYHIIAQTVGWFGFQ
jgi:hypothetical protein